MTAAIARMLVTIRRELIAWALAGAGLHLMIKNGINRWSLAAVTIALGLGASSRAKRKKEPPEEP